MSEGPGKDLIDRLTKAIAESEQALTELSQAHEHATLAADAFEATVPGTNIQDTADAAHQSRAATEAILPLAAELSTAIDTLRAYLNRLTGGASTALVGTQPETGEALLEKPEQTSKAGRLLDKVFEEVEDVSDVAGNSAVIIRHNLDEFYPDAGSGVAHAGMPNLPVAVGAGDQHEGVGAYDLVSNGVMIAIVSFKGGELAVRVIAAKFKTGIAKFREKRREHGR